MDRLDNPPRNSIGDRAGPRSRLNALRPLPEPHSDLQVTLHGTIALLRPTSHRGQRWLNTHIDPDHLEWAGAVVVEPRCLEDILQAATAAGLRAR